MAERPPPLERARQELERADLERGTSAFGGHLIRAVDALCDAVGPLQEALFTPAPGDRADAPCPFCGTVFDGEDGLCVIEADGHDHGFYVWCPECMTAGPEADTEHAALDLWNRCGCIACEHFTCQHCGELSTAEQPCPGRDDPGGPCEPPPSSEEREGMRLGLIAAIGVATKQRHDATSANGRLALDALIAELRAEVECLLKGGA